MHKVFNKIITFLMVTMLVGTSFIPTVVYAGNSINIGSQANDDRVKFDATIDGKHELEKDISGDTILDINLSVLETGYIRNPIITFVENNYDIQEIENENIKSIKGNVIELNEIKAGENIKLNIPIRVNKSALIDVNIFDKDSIVKLEAIYIDEEGKEKKIVNEVKEHIKWKTEADEEISQELVRYLKYNQNTMLSFKIKEGIQNNTYPVKDKEIDILVPKIDGKEPSKVLVTGTNVKYEYKDGILKIEKTNQINEQNEIVWNSIEIYMVTYIYESQTDNKTINIVSTAKATLVDGTIKEAKAENEFDIIAEVGNIIELSTIIPAEISEGYMYANLNREEKLETPFSVIYTANIGLAELTDRIVLEENENTILYTNTKKLNISDDIVSKRVLVIKDEIKTILGDDGVITVKDENGNELGKRSVENAQIEVNTNKIILETSTPVKEGNLHVKVDKVIAGTDYSKEQMKMFEKLLLNSTISGYKDDVEISKEKKTSEINLKAPISKASIDTSIKTLSTIAENRDVVFNIVLSNKDITDALYQNPKFKIQLPSQITNIQPTSAQILYDEEIKAGMVSINGNTIDVELTGTQTKYGTVGTTNGTLIRIVANLTLNNLAPSSTEKIKLSYSNELTGETNETETEVSIVAPTGFVTTNTLNIDGETVTAIESDAKEIKINKDTSTKEMKISATIVNNLGTDANGVTILGRIPFEGNKTVEGKELGSTVDTTILKAVTTEGLENATVYYSENGEESVSGNTWTTELTANTKSFKIVADDTLEDKTAASFNYSVNLPETLDYGSVAKATYGVLYSNQSTLGVKTNLVQAASVGASTGNVPELNVSVTAYDTNDGHAIEDNGSVRDGEYITYKVTLSNTGSEDLSNVKLKTKLPNEITQIIHQVNDWFNEYDDFNKGTNKEIENIIGTLKAKENKEIEITTQVLQGEIPEYDDEGEEVNVDEARKLSTNFTVTADNLDSDISKSFTVNNSDGSYAIKLRNSLAGNYSVINGQKINFVIDIQKIGDSSYSNTTVKLKLPDGIDYVSNYERILEYNQETNTKYDVNYENNEVIIKLDNNKTQYSINVETVVTEKDKKDLSIWATITYDGLEAPIQSNKLVLSSESVEQTIQATQKTNITTGTPLQTDVIEYYIDIKNTGNDARILTFEDNIPDELTVTSYSMIVDGETVHEGESSYIMTSFEVPAGKTARATIKATIEGEVGQTITNTPKLTSSTGQDIKINSISLNISNSGVTVSDNGYSIDDGSSNNAGNNNGESVTDGIYSISGTAWYDINNDGKKDDDEKRLQGVGMILLDAKTAEIAKDSNGKELRTSTNENGLYTFSNLNRGSYIAIAIYDISEYAVGTYRADGTSEIENSDFVTSTYNNEEVGATDVIEVAYSNTYNIDLALVSRNTFDLSLEKLISKITVTNPKSNTRTYDFNKNLVKVELSNKNIKDTTVLVEYKIKVTNEGRIAGYASSIVDYLPEGMSFNSELNSDWYIGQDGNAYNTSLANTIINPGETKEITLVLTKKMTGENTGTVRNTAEIQTSYNEYGIEDANSVTGNKQDGENDMSSADVTILIGPGRTIIRITGITVGILALITLVIYEIKKRVIDKF